MMIADRSERRRLAALDAKVRSLDIAIQSAEDSRASEERGRVSLAARLEAARAKASEDRAAAVDAAADVLVANPGASVATGLLARIRGARAEPADNIAALTAAVAKAGRNIDRRAGEIADLRTERAAAWQVLAEAAWAALAAEAERRLLPLHDEVLAPMRALRASASLPCGFLRAETKADEIEVTLLTISPTNVLDRKEHCIIPRKRMVEQGGTASFAGYSRMEPVDPAPYLDRLLAELRGERG